MLTYVLKENNLPLYEQVYQYIKADILNGVLKPGEKLPSKRTFANHNGISTITIQNAYDQLISEGYIYTIPKKGYYVADIAKMAKLKGQPKLTLDIRLPKELPEYRIDLSNNRVNPDHFPFSVWAKLSREIIAAKSRELMEPSPTGGIYELRSAIAEHLKSFRGMLVDPDQIIIGAGTEYLYGLLVQLLGTDLEYCIENPGYRKLAQIYSRYKINCKYANMDESGITVDELQRTRADIAHICPNHHFPTGITMPANRRYEVLAWANEGKERYIIEDDYDSEFRTNGKPLPTLFGIDTCGKVIYMNTFSKSLTPTIRISYMILPVHLANRFYRELSFYSCTVSNFEQYTLASFISKGYFEKHINRMRLYYSRQRKQLLEELESSRLMKICEIRENESGLHFLIRLDTGLSEEEIKEKLKKRGIRLQAVSDYCVPSDKSREHYFIINYSNIDVKLAREGFDQIYECLSGNRYKKLIE